MRQSITESLASLSRKSRVASHLARFIQFISAVAVNNSRYKCRGPTGVSIETWCFPEVDFKFQNLKFVPFTCTVVQCICTKKAGGFACGAVKTSKLYHLYSQKAGGFARGAVKTSKLYHLYSQKAGGFACGAVTTSKLQYLCSQKAGGFACGAVKTSKLYHLCSQKAGGFACGAVKTSKLYHLYS